GIGSGLQRDTIDRLKDRRQRDGYPRRNGRESAETAGHARFASQGKHEHNDTSEQHSHTGELAHVHRAPVDAVRVLGKYLWMLVGRHAVGMKDPRADEQEFATEDQRRSEAERGSVVHESVLLGVWCLNNASRLRSLVPSERVGNSSFPLTTRLLRKPT